MSRTGTNLSFEEQIDQVMSAEKPKLDPNRPDVILLLGITGVGKSTMAEILFGNLPGMECIYDKKRQRYELLNSKAARKPISQTRSDTVCPQLYTDPAHASIAIYDCPGFEDTRGTSNEIATGIYLARVLNSAKKVKLVVTVGYDAVEPDTDRSKFISRVVGGMLEFLAKLEGYQKSLLLLVTKYQNSAEMTQGPFPDHEIVESIAANLEDRQEDAEEAYPERRADVTAMFQTWLSKDASGKYPNIAFFRRIIDEGPLSEMPHVTTSKSVILDQLLKNDLFVMAPCSPEDFGRPISDRAKLEIQNYRENLANAMAEICEDLKDKIKEALAQSRTQMSKTFEYISRFRTLIDQLRSADTSDAVQIRALILENFKATLEFGKAIQLQYDYDKKYAGIEEALNNLTFLSSVDVEMATKVWTKVKANWDQIQACLCDAFDTEDSILRQSLVSSIATKVDQMMSEIHTEFVKSVPDWSIMSRCVCHFADTLNQLEEKERIFNENEAEEKKKIQPQLMHQYISILHEFAEKLQVKFSQLESLKGHLRLFDQIIQLEDTGKIVVTCDAGKTVVTWDNVYAKWMKAKIRIQQDIATASGLESTFPEGICSKISV